MLKNMPLNDWNAVVAFIGHLIKIQIYFRVKRIEKKNQNYERSCEFHPDRTTKSDMRTWKRRVYRQYARQRYTMLQNTIWTQFGY